MEKANNRLKSDIKTDNSLFDKVLGRDTISIGEVTVRMLIEFLEKIHSSIEEIVGELYMQALKTPVDCLRSNCRNCGKEFRAFEMVYICAEGGLLCEACETIRGKEVKADGL